MSADPVEVQALGRISDRLSFVYVERMSVSRQLNALTFATEKVTVPVPSASVACVLLGPGTVVSHQGVSLMAEAGVSAIWCGEEGARFYAGGSSLARSSRYLLRQAELSVHRTRRLSVARAMYAMRFPDEDVSRLTMQQLRGREGARVRAVYREESERWGIEWTKRSYVPGNFHASDAVNQALSAANASLYGIVHAATVALGCSPGLGFVHTGHHRAFIYDIADLYKAELSIPVAFEVAASELKPATAARRILRDRLHRSGLLPRICRDVRLLLFPAEAEEEPSELEGDVIYLWDDLAGRVRGGVNYEQEVRPPW
ncbi:MAG: type I-E CRISPR-associated endonuclease Cas1e [Nostocoides sp.]